MNFLCMLDADFDSFVPSNKFITVEAIADISDDLGKRISNARPTSIVPGSISLTEKIDYPTNLKDISFCINKLWNCSIDSYHQFKFIELYINEIDLCKLKEIGIKSNGKFIVSIDLTFKIIEDNYSNYTIIAGASISKKTQPDFIKKQYSKLEYLSIEWMYAPEVYYNDVKKQGFYSLKYWGDLMRGKIVDVTWGPTKEVLKVEKAISTSYKIDEYHSEVKLIDANHLFEQYDPTESQLTTVSITIPLTVYKRTGTWKYKRWFKIKRDIYEVAADVGIIVPGKGESYWDQYDEIIQSKYNPETGTCGFSIESKTPEEAASAYVDLILKRLIR